MCATSEVRGIRHIRDSGRGREKEAERSVELGGEERELPKCREGVATLKFFNASGLDPDGVSEVFRAHMIDLARPAESQGIDGRSRHRSTSWPPGGLHAAEWLSFYGYPTDEPRCSGT
ncbi:hypothetical protein GCM10009588_05300 [Microbacterium phyllosphaerae]